MADIAAAKRKKQMKGVFDDGDSSSESSGTEDSSDSENSSSEEELGKQEEKKAAASKKAKVADEDEDEVEGETELLREQRLFEQDEARRKAVELKSLQQQQKKKKSIQENSESEESSESESEEEEEEEDDDDYGAKKKKRTQPKGRVNKLRAGRGSRLVQHHSESEGSDEEVEDSEEEMHSDREVGKKRKGKDDSDEKSKETNKMEVDLGDLIAMQLSRSILVQWADELYFDQCIGGYVRLAIGTAPDNQREMVYRICEIIGTKSVKPYKIDGEMVEFELELRHGKFDKFWKLDSISNGHFTQAEFETWQSNMKTAKKKLPNKGAVAKYERRIKTNVMEYQPSEEEILAKIERRKRRRKSAVNLAFEKSNAERDLDAARESGASAQRIEELELQILQMKEEQERRARKVQEKFATNSNVNKRNQQMNRAAQGAPAEVIKSDGTKEWNPFARMPTRPINLWSTITPGEKLSDDEGEGKNGAKNASKSKDQGAGKRKEGGSENLKKDGNTDALGLSPFKKASTQVTEVKTIHGQINIELDDLDREGATSLASKTKRKANPFGNVSSSSKPSKKKRMSLAEYIRRVGGE